MTRVQQIISAFLVAWLVFLTGLGSSVHAMSNGCIGGQCEDHLQMPVESGHDAHALAEAVSGGHHPVGETEHEGCNPFLCQALALTSKHFETVSIEVVAALEWHVGHLSTLEEPNNPDRPPNL